MDHRGFNEFGNIFSYSSDRIKRNGVFSRANTVMKHARRGFLITRIIARIIKYASAIIAFIETSAVTVVIATILVISIPIAALTTAAVSLFSSYRLKKMSGDIAEMFDGEKKVIFILSEHGYNTEKAAFMRAQAHSFVDEGYRVFVVSQPIFRDGTTARKIKDDLWVIKLNSFYIIKRRFLKDFDDSKLIFVS